jgi:C_GCAxxG_C_C family probable redox protein
MKVGNAFGGGMGLMGGTCGVVTGAFVIIGLKFGASDVKDKESKARTSELVKRFAKEFEARNGSVTCRGLLGFDIGSREQYPGSGKIISKKCPGFIKNSVEILEAIFTEQKKEQILKGDRINAKEKKRDKS